LPGAGAYSSLAVLPPRAAIPKAAEGADTVLDRGVLQNNSELPPRKVGVGGPANPAGRPLRPKVHYDEWYECFGRSPSSTVSARLVALGDDDPHRVAGASNGNDVTRPGPIKNSVCAPGGLGLDRAL
jgi:hypothetical protein